MAVKELKLGHQNGKEDAVARTGLTPASFHEIPHPVPQTPKACAGVRTVEELPQQPNNTAAIMGSGAFTAISAKFQASRIDDPILEQCSTWRVVGT